MPVLTRETKSVDERMAFRRTLQTYSSNAIKVGYVYLNAQSAWMVIHGYLSRQQAQLKFTGVNVIARLHIY